MTDQLHHPLKVQRFLRGWTQETLARKARITLWRMNRIECRQIQPTPKEAAQLARALEMPVSELGL